MPHKGLIHTNHQPSRHHPNRVTTLPAPATQLWPQYQSGKLREREGACLTSLDWRTKEKKILLFRIYFTPNKEFIQGQCCSNCGLYFSAQCGSSTFPLLCKLTIQLFQHHESWRDYIPPPLVFMHVSWSINWMQAYYFSLPMTFCTTIMCILLLFSYLRIILNIYCIVYWRN